MIFFTTTVQVLSRSEKLFEEAQNLISKVHRIAVMSVLGTRGSMFCPSIIVLSVSYSSIHLLSASPSFRRFYLQPAFIADSQHLVLHHLSYTQPRSLCADVPATLHQCYAQDMQTSIKDMPLLRSSSFVLASSHHDLRAACQPTILSSFRKPEGRLRRYSGMCLNDRWSTSRDCIFLGKILLEVLAKATGRSQGTGSSDMIICTIGRKHSLQRPSIRTQG